MINPSAIILVKEEWTTIARVFPFRSISSTKS